MISDELRTWLGELCQRDFSDAVARPAAGGCIHESWLLRCDDEFSVFVKLNRLGFLEVFKAEERGLRLLADSRSIRVPRPFGSGLIDGRAVLAMEGLDLRSGGGSKAAERLADALALLHRCASPDGKFGADFDNHIGATPQSNRQHDRWADFFVSERLEFQFRLARDRGHPHRDAARLCERVHAHLDSLKVDPVLVHGDLWGGNVSFLPDGEPVVYDPACYFGDRETDLAFTKLFGGFPPHFHERYREHLPVPEAVRETIYNLYHLLNHDHLFGGSYRTSSEASIRAILRELG